MRDKNGRIVLVAICALLALAVPRISAQTVTPNADPGIPGEGYVTYTGHYGEVFKLRGGWEIRPSMHVETEVINYYPLDYNQPDRKPTDFIAENFTRDRLVQLIILPWSASSSKSLDALKRRKVEDLKSSGVEFRIVDNPFPGYGHLGREWPKGTFEVLIATPYLLSQLYTTSGRHLAILTTGWDTPPSTVISSHYDSMRMGLRDWVVPETGKEIPQTFGPVPARDIPEAGISLRVFAKPQIWMTWALVSGIACLLLGILNVTKRFDPLRRASLSLLVFSNAGALIGGAVGLVFWPFGWSAPHLPIPPAVACLFIPLLAWLMGRVRGRRPRRRALIGTAAWALTAATFLVYVSFISTLGAEWSAHIPSFTAMVAFVFYAAGGVIFGILDSVTSGGGGRRVLVALAILLISSRMVWAQPVPIENPVPNPIDGDASFIARQRLEAKGADPESFKKQAIRNLSETQDIYAYQRVEIKGIFAKGDTNDALKNLFDKQIEASHLGEKGNTVIPVPAKARAGWNHLKDLYDLHDETYGEYTEAAKLAVKELKDKEINEIVAHSWGSEIVYNAILKGDINPPRRLIVCGMPDRDLEKWRQLSKHTGTEVVVYTNSSDPIAGAARLGGWVQDRLGEAGRSQSPGLVIPRPIDLPTEQFAAQWATACRSRKCNPHARPLSEPNFNYSYKGATHDRYAYYQAMLNDGAIPANEADAYKLRDRQNATVAAEADRLYAAALDQEITQIGAAPIDGEASFLQGISRMTPLTKQARDTFADQEVAARIAWQKDPEYLAYQARSNEYRRKFNESLDARYEESKRASERWPDMRRRWKYLLATTGLACSNPDELERQARQGNMPGVSLADLDIAWQMNRIETVSSKDRPVANECQKYILTAINAAGSPVSGSQILAWARRYRNEHPSLWARFTTTIGEFFSAMGEAFEGDPTSSASAPSERSGGAASGSPVERPRPEAREPAVRHSPDNWESLRQLRGFKGF